MELAAPERLAERRASVELAVPEHVRQGAEALRQRRDRLEAAVAPTVSAVVNLQRVAVAEVLSVAGAALLPERQAAAAVAA